jgi:DNA-binding winged helix-turn-helix (wHTH) protein/TolB-like protein
MDSGASNLPSTERQSSVWKFGECEFDEARYELRVKGSVVDLESKPLEILHQLLLHSGEVVRKEDLLERVWPGVLVVEGSLTTAVSKLRKAVGDDESLIKTVPKLGYRLTASRIRDLKSELPQRETLISASDTAAVEVRGIVSRPVLRWSLALVLLTGISFLLLASKKVSHQNLIPAPVAILPFQNSSADPSLEYLRSALPDEVANTLSAARSLAVRPLASTGQFSDPKIDLRKAANQLGVSRIVTGHYVRVGEELQITVEAVDTDENRVLWRGTVAAPANNLLVLQAQVASVSRGKLAGALGIVDFAREAAPPPTNEEAYELYLRSEALDWDPQPNSEAIGLLRRSVAIDPTYAPAWGDLSLRYYTESRFGGGGHDMLQLSDAAAEREMALDPGSPGPVAELTIHRTERGELVKAHQQALELVHRRPDNPNNHHVLSYVLRYGGSLEEAGHECDLVVLLATKIIWGSCGTTFMELGNYAHSKDFIRKDLSSEWSKAHAVEVLLREGKTEEAIRIGPPKIAHWDSYKMLLACAANEPASKIKELMSQVEIDDDPEVNYFFAAHLAYCGQTQESFQMLKLAIAGNYCSYPTMDLDPLFDKVRKNPAFAAVRAEGKACHDDFVANHERSLPGVVRTGPLATAMIRFSTKTGASQ